MESLDTQVDFVLGVEKLQERIMAEFHHSHYSVHPGSTKIYHELKEVYWWNDIKNNIVELLLGLLIVSRSR